ncbi:glycosyltransferase family 8 protein [Helicobacter pylori]|uniref:Glycosyltransferase family 8 protein n=1 Tax=Helicobacter pylori TaxID=210 RepID=A0A518YE71_HELPX|nr:glycosyltransferase family 8 protein [Helicobacter pylori]QDY60363.1 glycosyltransferase family 8 protein [Helicobacter pylori]
MTSASSHSLKEQDFHIPIAFAFDKNYLIPAGACLYSLLESIAKANKKIRYTLHALVVGLNEEDKAKLNQITEPFKEFAVLEVKDIEPFLDAIPNPFDEDFTKRFSKMVLVKYFLADLFPKYSKMVWSDVDVIFCNEFSADFLNIKENDENYFYGVYDKIYPYEGFFYCNLTYQRKNQFCKKILEIIRAQKIDKEPQLTEFCRSKIAPLKIEYCIFPHYYRLSEEHLKGVANAIYHNTIKQALREPIVIQYDSHPYFQIKPWDYPFGLKADLWLNALAKTPFMSDYTKKMHTNESFYTTKMAEQHYFSSVKSSKEIVFKAPYLFFKSYLFVVFKERKIHSRAFELTCNLVKKFFNKLIYFVFLMPKALAKRVVSKILRVLGLHGIVKKILIKLLKKG